MSENKIRNLRSKISKSLRHSENKTLQKIGRKIKPKKAKPLPEYEKYFKNFEFKKADIKAKISKNAKFNNKKIALARMGVHLHFVTSEKNHLLPV